MQHRFFNSPNQSCSITLTLLQTTHARLVLVHPMLSLARYAHSLTLTPVSQSEAHVSTSGLPSELPHQLWPVSHPLDRLLTNTMHPTALGT